MNKKLACPMISRRNFEPYVSPADDSGRIIRTRRDAEKDMLDHNCMPAQDVKVKDKHKVRRDAQ